MTHKQILEQSAEILSAAKEEVLALLKDNTMAITVRTSMDRLINSMNFIIGNAQAAPENVGTAFPPVKNVMGSAIAAPKAIVAADLKPKEDEKSKFVDKVNALQADFSGLSNEKILEEFKTKEDLNAIRGVAKRVGLTDFKTAKIDNEFLDLIRAGLFQLVTDKIQKEEDEKNIAAAGTNIIPDNISANKDK